MTDVERGARLAALALDPRVDDEDPAHADINSVAGLVDLVRYVVAQEPLKAVVEVGSNVGVSTEVFLLFAERVVVVDPWPDDAKYREFMRRVGHYPNLKVVRDASPQAAEHFLDEEFDLVYINALHDYENVLTDFITWTGKVRCGGWVSGHDHVADVSGAGVIRAVNKYFPADQYARKVFADSSFLLPRP